MTAARTRCEVRDGVAWIALDDGKVNALSLERIDEIGAALDAAEAARALVVLRGRDGIFSAGFDLKTFALGPEPGAGMVLAGARLVERLLAFPRPVIAACTGHAYPAGAFLLLAADVRLGVPGPFRIGLNEVAIGLTVPRFAVELARHRLSPPAFARVTTAAMFAPDEALAAGYLDRLVPASELDAAVAREVERLLALDEKAYVATKARVNERVLAALRGAVASEHEQLGVSAPS